MDIYTHQLTTELRKELYELTGRYPVAILNELHRRKFDANRDKEQATFGVPEVEAAWDLYHQYIDEAKDEIGGVGLFFDLHGHGHTLQYAELGYLISGRRLDSGDFTANMSSLNNLAQSVDISFNDLLRGTTSFGGFLQAAGYDSVPGPNITSPSGNKYFSGGYNTRRHGSIDGGQIEGIQIESARSHRGMPERKSYVKALAKSMIAFFKAHFPNAAMLEKSTQEFELYTEIIPHSNANVIVPIYNLLTSLCIMNVMKFYYRFV